MTTTRDNLSPTRGGARKAQQEVQKEAADRQTINMPSSGIEAFSGSDTKIYAILYGGKTNAGVQQGEPDIVIPERLNSDKGLPGSFSVIDQNQGPEAPSLHMQKIADAQTITLSTFREKITVRSLGTISARGHARGTRTAAGTIIFTDLFYPNIYQFLIPATGDAQHGSYVLLDQIPPFDIMVYRANEFGLASFQIIFGVEFVTTGKVVSIHDMFTEKTVAYKALDFTESIPIQNENFASRLNSLAWKNAYGERRLGTNGIQTIQKYRDEWKTRNRSLV